LQAVEVLGDTAIADFAESEYAFENAEGMLNMGADALLGVVFGDLGHFLASYLYRVVYRPSRQCCNVEGAGRHGSRIGRDQSRIRFRMEQWGHGDGMQPMNIIWKYYPPEKFRHDESYPAFSHSSIASGQLSPAARTRCR
jgi:hypothetical protein